MADQRLVAHMRLALRLAARGYGHTSPNPMVGAVLEKSGQVIGKGWHRRAGLPHAEIEALLDTRRQGHATQGATLYVTLEPCSTHGRTPPCTDAIVAAGIKRVVAAATDPNPKHAGRGFDLLRRAGIQVISGVLDDDATRLNEAFNHWILHHTPFVTVKAAMSLDGKIATRTGESKWITGSRARTLGMLLRKRSDAILVGVNTVLADDPALTLRSVTGGAIAGVRQPLRVVLDSHARTPLDARLVSDEHAKKTVVVIGRGASKSKIARLAERVTVWKAPGSNGIDVPWVLRKLGQADVTNLLVEGGGEVNASFLFAGLAQRVAFFYAPKVMGGRKSKKSVGGNGVTELSDALNLSDAEWRRAGDDIFLTALVLER